MRVHELAKEFGMSSSKLIEEIKGYGIVVKSHLSGLDDDRVADIRHKHTVAQVAIRLENELQERKKEEIVVEEDWEFIDSEEVDELLVPEVEETEDENKSGGISDEMSETSGDTSAEQLSMEEIDREIEKNIENAGKAREEYAKSKPVVLVGEVDEQLNPIDEMEDGEETIEEKNERRTKEIAEENERVLAREEENKVEQEVIVEKPKGFWGWLKSLFT